MVKIEILKGKRESQGKKRIFLYEYDYELFSNPIKKVNKFLPPAK
jgi:hypothetical protein